MKILIVDDDPSCVIAMAQFFAMRGYEPEVALGRDEAKNLLAQRAFDAVITDMRLSEGESRQGLELLDFIRTRAVKTRVMVVTAYDGNDVRDEALRRGAERFFVKPVSLERLAAALDGVACTVE